MTIASQINAQLLIPFFRYHRCESYPLDEDIEQYINRETPTRDVAANLRLWQRANETGTVETDFCTNCWAISVLDTGRAAEPVLLNTCEGCYKTICNFCHVHNTGDERCLCGDCAGTPPAHQQ